MNQWFDPVYLLIPIIGLVLIFIARSRNTRHVNSGEALVRYKLSNYCASRNAHVLSNVTLRLHDGTTTQVDHILITVNGVFVIETKHYNGWIFADQKSKKWCQVLFKSRWFFQNPILQNYKHVNVVRNILDFLNPQHIHNIVVFSGDATFETSIPDNVYYIEDLITAIEQYTDNVMSLNRVQFCVGRLEYIRLELTRKTDIEHQEYLNYKYGAGYDEDFLI